MPTTSFDEGFVISARNAALFAELLLSAHPLSPSLSAKEIQARLDGGKRAIPELMAKIGNTLSH